MNIPQSLRIELIKARQLASDTQSIIENITTSEMDEELEGDFYDIIDLAEDLWSKLNDIVDSEKFPSTDPSSWTSSDDA